MSYASLASLRRYLGIPATETGGDTLLTGCLVRATAAIDGHTRRTFAAAADSTRSFDSRADVEGSVLWLDEDLCAVTSITNGDGTTVASTKYVTEPRNRTPWYALRLLASSGVVWEPQADGDTENAIVIVGRWAYSTTPPAAVEQACLELAKFFHDARKLDANDLNRTVIAGNATVLPASWPTTVRDALKPFVRLV